MRLRDMDRGTLAAVKAGLTLDHKDGTLLASDEEDVFFFTARIAEGHYLIVDLRNDWTIRIDTGVFRRPASHMRQMIRAQYAGTRIHRDAAGLAGEVGELIEPLTSDEYALYERNWTQLAARDRTIEDEFEPLF